MLIDDENYKKIINLLKEKNNILITSHINPDGDNIASCVALSLGLKQLNKNVKTVLYSPVPSIYKFLVESEQIIDFTKLDNENLTFDCVVLLDLNTLNRIGDGIDIRKYSNLILNLDHHIKTNECCDISFCDVTFSSTAEIIYNVLIDLGVKITSKIAEALYVGIMTDTGCFQFENTTSNAMKVIADLIEKGAQPDKLSKKVYFSNSVAKILLMGKVLSTLQIDKTGKIGWIVATKSVIDECNATSDDLENVINNVTSIETIEVAILFRDLNDGKIKLSLRSRNNIDVQKFALQFNGGGHKKASGIVISGKLDDVIKMIIEKLSQYINETI